MLHFAKFLVEVRNARRPHELFELAYGRGASDQALSAASSTRDGGVVREVWKRISRSDLRIALGVAHRQCSGLEAWLGALRAGLWRFGPTPRHHKIWAGVDAGARDRSPFGRIAARSGHAVADLARSGGLLGRKRCDADNLGAACVGGDGEGGSGDPETAQDAGEPDRGRRAGSICGLPIFYFPFRGTRPGYAKLRAEGFRVDFA
jgi:hypothetical protein